MKGLQHTDRVEAYAQSYPTSDRIFVEANANSTEIIAQVPELNMVKPYFLSHFPFMGKNYVCSGTMQVFNAETSPYIGILMRDTVPGDLAGYRTSGKHYLPVHTSVTENDYESISWVGKTAFLVVEGDDWGVTPTPLGLSAICIGRFVERYTFRPNGIKWGDRFAKVELDPGLAANNEPITVTANTSGSCCFGDCKVTAFPRVKNAHGKLVTIAANAFAFNPIYDITRIEWCWSGQEETITSGGNTITQPKADAWGSSDTQTIKFDDYGEHTVTIRVFLSKDGGCGCGCGDSSCCVVKELIVDVQPNAAYVCIPGSSSSGGGGTGVTDGNTWSLFASYKDNDLLVPDTISSMKISGTGYAFAGGISVSDTSNVSDAIETVLNAQGVTFGSITVNFSAAGAIGEHAVLNVLVTGVDTAFTLDGMTIDIDGSATSFAFGLIA